MRKRSYKLSAASIAALSLPMLGVGVAAAQPFTSESAPLVAERTPSAASSLSSSDGNSPTAVAVVARSRADVEQATIDPLHGWAEADLDAYAAYWRAGYNYQQLLVLADEWNVSEFEAKGRAGQAIMSGDTSSFDGIVQGIAPGPDEIEVGEIEDVIEAGPTDAFWDAGYLYEDAVALAAAWNTDSYQAKILAADLIESGDESEVQAALGQL